MSSTRVFSKSVVKDNLFHLLLVCFYVQDFLGLLAEAEIGVKSHCQVTTSGKSANVTCIFGEDLSSTNRDFSILRYRQDKEFPAAALTCTWLDVRDLKCVATDGYTYDRNVSTTVVLGIPHVTDEFHGKYACQGVHASPHEITPCVLEPREKLEPPYGVKQLNATYESITLGWHDYDYGTPGRSYLLRYRPKEDGASESVAKVSHSTDTNFTITGLAPGSTYEISVAAVDSLGESSADSPKILANTTSLLTFFSGSKESNTTAIVVLSVLLGVCLTCLVALLVLNYRRCARCIRRLINVMRYKDDRKPTDPTLFPRSDSDADDQCGRFMVELVQDATNTKGKDIHLKSLELPGHKVHRTV